MLKADSSLPCLCYYHTAVKICPTHFLCCSAESSWILFGFGRICWCLPVFLMTSCTQVTDETNISAGLATPPLLLRAIELYSSERSCDQIFSLARRKCIFFV
ncbi:hypothetical protein KSP39_PZI017515 [Platanthera zijinensis]|uniref:Uncharacterized protein n=1 Tax=Platanthera zijinensis TaxID=2320716 RepID=A0AAP0B513_9ASPA